MEVWNELWFCAGEDYRGEKIEQKGSVTVYFSPPELSQNNNKNKCLGTLGSRATGRTEYNSPHGEPLAVLAKSPKQALAMT